MKFEHNHDLLSFFQSQAAFYLFIIFTASTVTHQAKKTYKVLASFYCRLMREYEPGKENMRLKACYKVERNLFKNNLI